MDALSDVLRHVRMTGSLFCRAELTGPWSVKTTGADGSIFHVIVQGAGWVATQDGELRAYRAGDLIVLPHGQAHVMAHSREHARFSRAVPIASLPTETGAGILPTVRIDHDARTLRKQGTPERRDADAAEATSILCGVFRVADDSRDYLLPLLPGLIHVAGSASNTAAWLDATLRMMAMEVDAGQPGADVILDRLADILAVKVLRSVIESGPEKTGGWLAALRDPRLSRTLDLIHSDPARPWTADILARRAGMSRSVLFRRFTAMVGESPLAYLTRWRMYMARMALAREEVGVARVAERVGYASEAAFNRAFRRATGVTPAVYRQQARAPGNPGAQSQASGRQGAGARAVQNAAA